MKKGIIKVMRILDSILMVVWLLSTAICLYGLLYCIATGGTK
jgi:hypothetical protein